MRAAEPRQIDERFDAWMAVHDRRVQHAWRSTPNARQELVKCGRGTGVRSQACVRLTDRLVGLSSVVPNETFSRRHDVLPSFSNLVCG